MSEGDVLRIYTKVSRRDELMPACTVLIPRFVSLDDVLCRRVTVGFVDEEGLLGLAT